MTAHPARRSAAVVLGALALSTLTACGAATVQGSALRDPRIAKDAVIPGLLNPGNYPTKPLPAMGTAGSLEKGGWVESRRMADYVVMPFEVDPTLTKSGGIGQGVIKNAAALVVADIPESITAGGPDRHFVAGFTVVAEAAGTDFQASLRNTVLRYATPEDAAGAVNDLASHSGTYTASAGGGSYPTQPIAIPRSPATRAFTFRGGLTGNSDVLAYTAHGPYVLIQLTIAKAGAQNAADLAAATLDKQVPLIDTFAATPVDKLADLPVDPDGLLARTLPEEGSKTVNAGVYGAHGILAFSSDPASDQKLLGDTGVDVVARAGAAVYRAKDAAGAATIVEQFATGTQKQGFTPVAAVPGLPAARCLSKTAASGMALTYCVAAADRYAMEISAPKDAVAYQMGAAQYLMLTR